MIFLSFLIAGLAAANTQVRPIDLMVKPKWNADLGLNPPNILHNPNNLINPSDPNSPKSNTVIENKNVNVVVNVDPKDVAKELWKLIQGRMDERQQTRRSDDSGVKINEIEEIITPILSSTRRTNRPTAFEVAYALDHITRKSLVKDHLAHPTIDDEINTREIVAKMMIMLKSFSEKKDAPVNQLGNRNFPSTRRMQVLREDQSENNYSKYNDYDDGGGDDDDDDDEYIRFKLKIRKSELLRRGKTSTYIDF